jgi:hypothetical protein
MNQLNLSPTLSSSLAFSPTSPAPDPAPADAIALCYYCNSTPAIQVLRIDVYPEFEHVLFPSQRFLFESPGTALLQIYSAVSTSPNPASPDPASLDSQALTPSAVQLVTQISCSKLQVDSP